MSKLKYHLSFAELLDRLMLCQLKENHGADYKQEIRDIMNDIDFHLNSGVSVDAKLLRALIVLTQSNSFIWTNEDNARNGTPENNNLWFTHQLNANRSEAKAQIQALIGGRKDEKLNYMNSIWKISW